MQRRPNTRNRTTAAILLSGVVVVSLTIELSTATSAVGAAGTTTTTPTTLPIVTTTTTPHDPARQPRAVAAGNDHACAVLETGQVKCWGHNNFGQLGDGTTVDRQSAVAVKGLPPVYGIAAGGDHTCAWTSSWDADLYCWGRNDFGQLGDGTVTSRTTAIRTIVNGENVRLVALGGDHTCAVTASQGLFCWGLNTSGQLGIAIKGQLAPTMVIAPTPLPAVGVTFHHLTLGTSSTCAQAMAGNDLKTACAGTNNGLYGDGTTVGSGTMISVPGAQQVRASDAGSHLCRVLGDRSLQCVGPNANGAIGNGTKVAALTAIRVAGVFSTVTTGRTNFTCAFETASREYRCWGRNVDGQLGDGTTVSKVWPTPVPGITGPRIPWIEPSISAGRAHTCAIGGGAVGKSDRVYCWGSDTAGQLGNGSVSGSRTSPGVVSGI